MHPACHRFYGGGVRLHIPVRRVLVYGRPWIACGCLCPAGGHLWISCGCLYCGHLWIACVRRMLASDRLWLVFWHLWLVYGLRMLVFWHL